METRKPSKAQRLRELINRKEKVLAVLHPPSVALGRIMDAAGCEAGFVGTSAVVGSYTGLADVGTATMMECVQIGGWIARAVSYPVILDGDTGHGGIMAVRRLVQESIAAGLSGIRIDDQPVEGKRRTGRAGVEVVPLPDAIARYRAAIDARNEIDPDFVVMAQCYAGNARNNTFADTLTRLKAYRAEAGVDWVQFEYPRSLDEVRSARAAVDGPFSFMKGGLGRYLSLKEHMELGVHIAWYPVFTHRVTWAALRHFMNDFMQRDIAAWDDFTRNELTEPCPDPLDGGAFSESADRQLELELKYSGRDRDTGQELATP